MSKAKRLRSLLFAVSALTVVALVTVGAISASAADDDSAANQLVGSWELTVNRGPQLPPVKGLTTYTRGHSLIGTANVLVRGPAHGNWKHVSGRLYADTHIFFSQRTGAEMITVRSDADGEFVTGLQRPLDSTDIQELSGNQGRAFLRTEMSYWLLWLAGKKE